MRSVRCATLGLRPRVTRTPNGVSLMRDVTAIVAVVSPTHIAHRFRLDADDKSRGTRLDGSATTAIVRMLAMLRIRPRFSVRTLVIFMTLACIYFAAWSFTRRHGPRDVFSMLTAEYSHSWVDDSYILQAQNEGVVSVPMPFVVTIDHQLPLSNNSKPTQYTREYYLWFNGWTTPVSPQKPQLYQDLSEITFFFKFSR